MYDRLTVVVRYGAMVVRCLWWLTVVSGATAFGAFYGWQNHGWPGAISLGLVGFGAGMAFAAAPTSCLEILVDFARIF
ncbi:hypothetical protein QM996_10050 [Sinorhizobium chiapasense]